MYITQRSPDSLAGLRGKEGLQERRGREKKEGEGGGGTG